MPRPQLRSPPMTASSSYPYSPTPTTVGAEQTPRGEKSSSPELRQMRQQLTQVRAAIRAAMDSETLLAIAVEQIRHQTQASRAIAYRFINSNQGEIVAESIERGWTPTQGETLPATFFGVDTQTEYDQREVVTIEYVASTDVTPYQLQLMEKYQVRSSLAVVVRLGHGVWGLLVVQQCQEARQWSPWEMTFIEQVGLLMAVQLASEEGQRQLQAQRSRDEALERVGDRLRRAADIHTIGQTATQELRQLLKADRVVLYQFNPDWSGQFVGESVGAGWVSLLQNPPDPELLRDNSANCNLKPIGRQLGAVASPTVDTHLQRTQGGPYNRGEKQRVVTDIYRQDFPGCYLELLERIQARAYITVGVYQGGQLWGLLATYQCMGARQWQDWEVRLATEVAVELGAALQRLWVNHQQTAITMELQQAVEREKAIARVAEKIQQSQDAATIFRTAVEEARQLLKGDRVGIYRFNPDWSGEFIAESVDPQWKSLLNAQVTDERVLAGTERNINTAGCTIKDMQVRELASLDTYLKDTQGGAYRKGVQFRVSNDVYHSGFSDCYLQLLESFQAKAYINVPIFLKDQLWGLMPCYQCSGPRVWTDAEITLMVSLSNQLGIALQRAADLEAVTSQTAKLTAAVKRERTLALVSDRIKQTQDTDAIFKIATSEVRELLQADRVGVYRFNPDWSGEFVAESVVGQWKSLLREQIADESLLEATRVNIDSEGCTIKQMTTQEIVSKDTYLERTQGGTYAQGDPVRICNDVYNAGFPRCYLELLERFQARAYVTVPIFLGRKLWGLMASYQCAQPRTWTKEEISLVVQLGSQLGIALQRASDLDAVKQQAAKLEKAVERERAIASISDKIRASQNVTSIFQSTTREARQLFESDRVGIYRFNPDWSGEFVAESVGSNWLSLLNYQVEDPNLLEQAKVNIDTEGCTIKQMQVRQMGSKDTYLQATEGGAYRQGMPARVCNDIYKAGFPPCYVELLEAFQARAYITVPIFLGDRLWGLMANYQCSGPRSWQNEDVQLMVQLGSQLGIALQRAADLEKLRQQAQELESAATREKAERQGLQRRALDLLTAVRPALEGDLTVRAPLSEDELGTIADVYNNTLQSLRGIVIQVQDVTARVAETSKSSDLQIRKLADQAQQQALELNQALEEVQAMVSSTQAVGANAVAIEQAVQNANQTVTSGDAAMNRTVEGILAIRDTVSAASQKIRELSESSQKIDRVVNLISDFATQTQLLSLNAAIEATRAGEYGKGFAVVADEVRSLARQSASATLEISNLVAEIRQQTSEVIKVTEAAITQVSAGTSLVEETKGNLTAIAAATAQISELVASISTATTAQVEQSKSVTQTMREVAEISNSTSAESAQLSSTFQDTLNTAQRLQEVVKQFKVN
ncbi:MAG: GAF domain-containing protein [Spirulina sp. DLM2.Bin59]|nr:MAG: GAF domain-containing protein [Spirulina sp. DLM2.Bin59]